MSMNNLSSVAAAVIDSYGHTALNVIHAYRAGGERVIGFVDQRFEAVVNADAVKLGEPLRSNLIDTQQRLSGYSTQGLHFGTERAASAVNSAVDLAHKGARRIAANAERFDQATAVSTDEWIADIEAQQEFFDKIGDSMPKALVKQRELLLESLRTAPPAKAK